MAHVKCFLWLYKASAKWIGTTSNLLLIEMVLSIFLSIESLILPQIYETIAIKHDLAFSSTSIRRAVIKGLDRCLLHLVNHLVHLSVLRRFTVPRPVQVLKHKISVIDVLSHPVVISLTSSIDLREHMAA